MHPRKCLSPTNPDIKVHGANMGPTGVLSAPGGPHVGPINLAVRECIHMHSPGWMRICLARLEF